jgi:peptide/nickel transport system permease protein
LAYLLRRSLHGAVLLAAVSVFSFALADLAPGDFLAEMKLDPRIAPETVAALKAAYGLDRPLPIRYLRWLRSVLRGDLGFSMTYMSPVAPLVWPRALNTLLLSCIATLVAWLLAVPIGVWSAARQGHTADRAVSAATAGLLALPNLLVALALVLLAVRTGWFPTGGMTSAGFAARDFSGKAADVAAHLFLPVLALVVTTVPVLVRHVRASMVEVLASPFLRATRAHGIPRRRLLFRHALPAAANPLVSLFGLSMAALLSGSLLVEVVMGWPGLGPLLFQAILARDLHLVIGPVLVSTLFLLGGTFAADVLLYAVDPRIRRPAP